MFVPLASDSRGTRRVRASASADFVNAASLLVTVVSTPSHAFYIPLVTASCRYIGAPPCTEEAKRLETLRSYDIMDTARDNKALNSITAMLAKVRNVKLEEAVCQCYRRNMIVGNLNWELSGSS